MREGLCLSWFKMKRERLLASGLAAGAGGEQANEMQGIDSVSVGKGIMMKIMMMV